MTEELKHGPADEGYERQDLSAQSVFAFLVSLVVGGVIVYFIVWGLYHFMDARQRRRQPQQSPLVKQVETDTRIVSPDEIKKFPEPRLERNERIEINDFRLKEEQTLNSYGWVDEKAGIAHIPIDRAMDLTIPRITSICAQGCTKTGDLQTSEKGDISTGKITTGKTSAK